MPNLWAIMATLPCLCSQHVCLGRGMESPQLPGLVPKAAFSSGLLSVHDHGNSTLISKMTRAGADLWMVINSIHTFLVGSAVMVSSHSEDDNYICQRMIMTKASSGTSRHLSFSFSEIQLNSSSLLTLYTQLFPPPWLHSPLGSELHSFHG